MGLAVAAREADAASPAMRAEDHAAAWRRIQRSVERADRPRAEAALRALYADAGLGRPRIVWVASPVAGMQAYHVAAAGGSPIVGHYTRGDVGSGANREWNALAEPFDIDPRWLRSLRHLIGRQLPRPLADRVLDGELFVTGGAAFTALVAHLRTAVPAPPTPQSQPIEDPLIERIGRAALGIAWDRYEGIIGNVLMRELIRNAIASTARGLLDTHEWWGVAASRPPVQTAIRAMQPGQFGAAWPAYGLVLGTLQMPRWRASGRRRAARLGHHLRLAESAGPWWALDGLAIVCERPVVARSDASGRPHSESGPALAWGDGTQIWMWHGVGVPDWVVLHPERIDVRAISREDNMEVRRVMVERVGWERIAREGGARLLQEDSTGRLWETTRPLEGFSWGANAKFVEVENSTPEPDGTRRHYYIRVPPDTRTARAAVAWTFALGELDYQPLAES